RSPIRVRQWCPPRQGTIEQAQQRYAARWTAGGAKFGSPAEPVRRGCDAGDRQRRIRQQRAQREITKYLFVSPNVVSASMCRSFDNVGVRSGVWLTSVAADRRSAIARTGDVRRRGPCHPGQEKCRFLR